MRSQNVKPRQNSCAYTISYAHLRRINTLKRAHHFAIGPSGKMIQNTHQFFRKNSAYRGLTMAGFMTGLQNHIPMPAIKGNMLQRRRQNLIAYYLYIAFVHEKNIGYEIRSVILK